MTTTTNSKGNNDLAYIATALRNLDKMAGVFEDLLPSIATLALNHAVGQERIEDIPARLDRMEATLERIAKATLLHQEELQVTTATNGLWEQIKREVIESLERRIRQQVQNLNTSLEEAATYGANPPLELKNQISGIKNEIESLKFELKTNKEKQVEND